MNWENCVSNLRTGRPRVSETQRTEYQRDYDRLIFSSAFRRLQNKTQVFPLPGNVFVHNRLTHSLEVACVGRSLGSLAGAYIAQNLTFDSDIKSFYEYQLSSVVAAACLAHDVGNPAFGHSGEKAISNYFIQYEKIEIDGRPLITFYDQAQWTDLCNFEGNANAFRILTRHYEGKSQGGLQLTYTTLASIMKYPCHSMAVDKNHVHRKKYGFFCNDVSLMNDVAIETHMIHDNTGTTNTYKRHPFVYLVEAADDICYRVIDLEDAHRLGIFTTKQTEELLIGVIEDLNRKENSESEIKDKAHHLQDANEKIAYLRSKVINTLVQQSVEIFIENTNAIISGNYSLSLVDEIHPESIHLQEIQKESIARIYNHPSVVEVELAGYTVMSELLNLFVPAVLADKPTPLQQKLLMLIPAQYGIKPNVSPFEKTLNVVDYLAGMTDGYAIELYRKLKGIEIARHRP